MVYVKTFGQGESPRNPSTRHLDGQNLEVAFLDRQFFVVDHTILTSSQMLSGII